MTVVSGLLVVDVSRLAERELGWPEAGRVRMALWAIEQVPPGGRVRLKVDGIAFIPDYVAGIDLGHAVIEVESADPTRLHQWVRGLREACAGHVGAI